MMEFLELAARGKTAWWRYLVTIVLALLLLVVVCAVAIAALEIAGVSPLAIRDAVSQPKRYQVFLGANGALFGALLLSFLLAIRLLHKKRFADVVGIWSWRRLFIGAGVWLALNGAMSLVPGPSIVRFTGSWATANLALWALPVLTVQTFTEEFIFRGYITQALLLATRRPLVTAVLSGLVFGAFHIPNGWPQAAGAAVFGILTALIAMRTAGIAFTFGLHLANNLIAAVVVVSANDVFRGIPGLFTDYSPKNLMWLGDLVPLGALLAVLWLFRDLLRGNRLAAVSPRPS
jgi:uncharacterized protein